MKEMINFKRTALVLIDLQTGIVAPRNGSKVVECAQELVHLFHAHQGLVVFVTVDFTDGGEILHVRSDKPAFGDKPPEGWATLDPALGAEPHDLRIVKRQWSAFFGTELDLQLRRRQIDTIVIGGISTNRGVESTARDAFQLGYHQIFAVDAMKANSQAEHEATVQYIFPYMGHVCTTQQIIEQARQ
ncbi:MAG: isochorismatase family protein [Sporolactobacillus sp.]